MRISPRSGGRERKEGRVTGVASSKRVSGERREVDAFPFSPFPSWRQMRVAAAAAGLSEPQAAGRKRPSAAAKRVGRPSAEGLRRLRPSKRGSAAIPGCIAPRPLPSPRPASPRPGPPPCQLREAGTRRRRRRLLLSSLSHSQGSPAVAAPSEAQSWSRKPVGQPAGGRTP